MEWLQVFGLSSSFVASFAHVTVVVTDSFVSLNASLGTVFSSSALGETESPDVRLSISQFLYVEI